LIGDEQTRLAWQPWFAEAITHARLRHGARVLQLFAHGDEQTRVVLARIGDRGTLTVVDPDRYRAGRVMELDHPGLAVLGYEPDGEESFGIHDAMLACPPVLDDWPLNRWGELALHNLRPGGRIVLDLPGQQHCEVLSELWKEIHGPIERLGRWSGPAPKALAKLLHADGLREIEASETTHLVQFTNASEAATWCGSLLDASDELIASLRLAIARRFRTDADIELVFRRGRVLAMR
jgi:hypothetical protein